MNALTFPAGQDDLVRFAADLCATPFALIGYAGDGGTRLESLHGIDSSDAAIGRIAALVSADGEMVEVADLAGTGGATFARFGAVAALRSATGSTIGFLAVIDTALRPTGLDALQRRGLKLLADQLSYQVELRRAAADRAAGTSASEAALAASNQRFTVLADTMPQMVWSTLPDGMHDYYNARWYEFTGVPRGSTDGEAWNGMFHPDDQPKAWQRWRHSLATGEPYEIEYRLRHHSGVYRWTLGRALPIRDDDGAIVRWFGTCTDIDEQKRTSEEREVIAHELSHRIKNIFSVISGLIGLSARSHPEIREVANDLRDRVLALGRAHDFVRPHSEESRAGRQLSSLKGLLAELVAPYQDQAGERIAIAGEDADVDDRSATPLALIFHELLTNAAKYGALSADAGKVAITIGHEGDDWSIDWNENGGPAVAAPLRRGFGTRLIELSIERQLGGKIVRDWPATGLQARIIVPQTAMSRPTA
jgi:PAS domain S-box-containing protein